MLFFFGQIEAEALYSVDGIVYSLVGKELYLKPFLEWSILSWNGVGFYEHPHLTPWLIALSYRIFGIGTVPSLLPALLLSLSTVFVTYRIGKLTVGHRFGILAGTILTLTPQFIKDGRNPMLEPALMFCIMTALYFHLNWWRGGKTKNSLLAGVFVALSFLAKGPPALLALGAIGIISAVFMTWKNIFPYGGEHSYRRMITHVLSIILIPVFLLGLIDYWHFLIHGDSFFYRYFSNQLQNTVVNSRGKTENNWFYYLIIVKRIVPWILFLVAAPFLAWMKKGQVELAPLVVGLTVVLATIIGFSLMKYKSPWYVSIYYSGIALAASTSVYYLLKPEWISKYYIRFVLGVTLIVLLPSASFPSLFIYPRVHEKFLENTQKVVGNRYQGAMIADCVSLIDNWRGPFFVNFYLSARIVSCDNTSTKLKIVNLKSHVFSKNERVIFSHFPIALIER